MAQKSPQIRWLSRHAAWLIVGAVILFSIVVRVRLREMPLERDEGEYAYAGQLMLQGIPPYKLAFNMKLPGTYAAYALIMALFGQTASGIHFGLALINAATIGMMFMVGRHFLDEVAGIAAAIIFALMSLSPSVLGLAAHATHFVVFFSLAGILVLVKASRENQTIPTEPLPTPSPCPTGSGRRESGYIIASGGSRKFGLLLSGILFGLAFLMKQHGLLFALFGLFYLAWLRITSGVWIPKAQRDSARGYRASQRKWRVAWPLAVKESSLFIAGLAVPFILTCFLLAIAGVFHEFVFWTITYARKYISAISMSEGPAYLQNSLGGIFSENPFFWILAAIGSVVIWWEDRLRGGQVALTVFLICSVAAVSAGFYFRQHYFIQLLPILALLGGIAASRAVHLIRHDRSIELLLGAVSLVLLVISMITSFVESGPLWFSLSAAQASDRVYRSSLFSASAEAGNYLRTHSQPGSKITVLGSEPEIFFYAHRHSATGFIYMYPMMDSHDYALKMQEQLIAATESIRPDYIVFVNVHFSWLARERSPKKIFQWWNGYWNTHYDIDRSIPIFVSKEEVIAEVSISSSNLDPSNFLLILKRKEKN